LWAQPSVSDLIDEIKQKFLDKEGSEMRYIKCHLKAFQKYEDQKLSPNGVEEDDTHERSRRIIEIWKDSKKLKGYTVLDDDGNAVKKKGHGKGKSKLFHFECIATPPSRGGYQSATFSSGSTGSSGVSSSTSSQSSGSDGAILMSSSSSSSSSAFSHKRPYDMFSSQDDAETQMYDDMAEEEYDEYALPDPRRGSKARQLLRQGRAKEAAYERKFKDGDDEEVDEHDDEEEEEEEDREEESQYNVDRRKFD
jgi:hypothetical protein